MATTTPTHAATEVKAKEDVELTALDREVGAAFIASGIGAFVLGILIVITEMPSAVAFKNTLVFVGPAGPLSGKTTLAVIAFVASWVILHYVFKSKAVKLATSFAITIVLLVLGLVLSFPPVFDLFAK